MGILKILGGKNSYIILRGLSENKNGLRFTDIQFDIVKNSMTSKTLKDLEKVNLIRQDENRLYHITKKGEGVFLDLDSIIKTDAEIYPDTLYQKTS